MKSQTRAGKKSTWLRHCGSFRRADERRLPCCAVNTRNFSPCLRAFLDSAGGDFLFSTTAVKSPSTALARQRHGSISSCERTSKRKGCRSRLRYSRYTSDMPTRFSALPVEDIVRELLVAHARPGLHKVYDLHPYEKEKADALKLWHEKLKHIVGGKLVL